MIIIRQAQADDIASILRIEKKSFARDAWDREGVHRLSVKRSPSTALLRAWPDGRQAIGDKAA
jgi:predicted N-acetyltransferase YhbS